MTESTPGGPDRAPHEVLAGRGKIGLALGSGAAKGWAHIGVIRALESMGVRPDVVCGTSMGAIVGAAYSADRLDAFEAWAGELEWHRVVSYLDLSMRGGLIKARRLFEFFERELQGMMIQDLPRAFAAVGTDLATGQEVWMREGVLNDALRATIALPGLITPAPWRGRWMVDGGLVNPVPVSLCRALGADFVIAVDLNTTLLGRRLSSDLGRDDDTPASLAAGDGDGPAEPSAPEIDAPTSGPDESEVRLDLEPSDIELEAAGSSLGDRLNAAFREIAGDLRDRLKSDSTGAGARDASDIMPSVFEVTANSINIMQVRIGRSRMAGDPPELLITPRMHDYGLLDFDRADEAILEGGRAVERAWVAGFGAA